MNLRDTVITNLKEYNLGIFPLKDKRPSVSNWQNYDGQTREDQSFGIVLGGESKVFVIDVDDYSLISHFEQFLDKTYMVKTGKGFHIFVKANTLPPTTRLNNKQGQHIDIQSSGTYVVGETSKHYAKNSNGKYVETGKTYEIISNQRTINNIEYEAEVKPILEKLGFDTAKKSIKHELSEAIKNGIPEGNRNNALFKLSCHILTTIKDIETSYNTISTINEKSDKPLDKDELDLLFASAKTRTHDEILESNQNFKIDDRTEWKILDESPSELRAITLDENKTRWILVYLPTKITENELEQYDSKAYFVSNGIDGKTILPIDTPELKQRYVSSIFSSYKILSGKWKYKDIQKYIQSDEKVNPKQIFDDLYNLERIYFENEFEHDYYYEPCWITHTYFYTLFDVTPYNNYSGMKNVGKSKRLNFLRMLCYNGILSGDSSTSSVFRTIQGTGATLLLDETENLGGGKNDRTDLEALLRNGFSKGGMVTRSKEGKNKEFIPDLFSVYSPKGFGHINGFDNVLEDRCIKTRLTRTTNKKIADSEPDEKEDQLIYKIRESLYRLFLDYADEIYELIPQAKSLIKELSGREMKLWLPVITIALFYQNHGIEKLVEKITAKMLLTSEDKKISDLEDNTDFKILQIMDSENIQQLPTTSKMLYDKINAELENQFSMEHQSDKKIKESLERLGFRNKRTSRGIEWTNITFEKIQEAKERVGLIESTQITLSESDSGNASVGNATSVGSVVQ